MRRIASLLLLLGSAAMAGELPTPPSELAYPNIVKPTFQFKAWGLGAQQLNDPYTCRHLNDGNLLIADYENHSLKTLDFKTSVLHTIALHDRSGRDLRDLLPYAAVMAGSHIYVSDHSRQRLLDFDADGTLRRAFGPQGELGRLSDPEKIAVSGERIAVADPGHDRVVIYSMSGAVKKELGSFGHGVAEFASPESVAFDRAGNLYVLDTYNNRVQVFDPKYKFLRQWGRWGSFKSFLANPSDIAIDDTNVFITDLLNHRVQAFDLTGKFLYQFGRHPPTAHEGNGRIHYPTSVSVSPIDKSIATCEPFESRVQRFALTDATAVKNVNDSAWWDKATKFHYGSRVVASARTLVISEPDTHAILMFDLNGHDPTLAEIVGGQGTSPGQFIKPSGMALDPTAQRLLISDSGNHRIQEFAIDHAEINRAVAASRNAQPLSAMAAVKASMDALVSGIPLAAKSMKFVASHEIVMSPPNDDRSKLRLMALRTNASPDNVIEPSALRFGPDGKVYMADPKNNRILVLDKNYQPVAVIGRVPDGSLNHPLDFSFSRDGQYIFVVDHYNYRIMKFTTGGEFVSQIGGAGSTPGRFVLPFGIISGKDGFVYVSDVGQQVVEKFTEDGVFIKEWGSWGTDPGQFYKPKGLAQLDDLTLVVVDFGNHRAQMFTPDGDYVRTFGIENAVVTVSRP